MNLSQAALDPGGSDQLRALLHAARLPRDSTARRSRRGPSLVVTRRATTRCRRRAGMAFARAAGPLPFLPPGGGRRRCPTTPTTRRRTSLWERVGRALARPGADRQRGRWRAWRACSAAAAPPGAGATTCRRRRWTARRLRRTTPTPARTRSTTATGWARSCRGSTGSRTRRPPLRLARLARSARVDERASSTACGLRASRACRFADGRRVDARTRRSSGCSTRTCSRSGDHDWSFGDPCQSWDGDDVHGRPARALLRHRRAGPLLPEPPAHRTSAWRRRGARSCRRPRDPDRWNEARRG